MPSNKLPSRKVKRASVHYSTNVGPSRKIKPSKHSRFGGFLFTQVIYCETIFSWGTTQNKNLKGELALAAAKGRSALRRIRNKNIFLILNATQKELKNKKNCSV